MWHHPYPTETLPKKWESSEKNLCSGLEHYIIKYIYFLKRISFKFNIKTEKKHEHILIQVLNSAPKYNFMAPAREKSADTSVRPVKSPQLSADVVLQHWRWEADWETPFMVCGFCYMRVMRCNLKKKTQMIEISPVCALLSLNGFILDLSLCKQIKDKNRQHVSSRRNTFCLLLRVCGTQPEARSSSWRRRSLKRFTDVKFHFLNVL